MLKIHLSRDLKRNIMRGHPWVYKEALKHSPRQDKAELCQVLTSRGQALAWAIYDPHNPIALRILSHEKKPPTWSTYTKRFQQALELRERVISQETGAYRLFNGEGDRLPGLVCDIYGKTAVVQFDGLGPSQFWESDKIADWLLQNASVESVIDKSRLGEKGRPERIGGKDYEPEVTILENSLEFIVNLEQGQKTGFFLDQRDNRQYVRSISHGLHVLNLFSYTGGFSIYAGAGGAKQVTSVDISKGALDLAERNWLINDLPSAHHQVQASDVAEFLTQTEKKWDLIIVDPPSMAHAEKHKAQGVKKYVDIFSHAAKKVAPGGHLIVSSCSSHISFDDFFSIITEALSSARTRGQILRISGQGADHPFPHASHEMRYLKFVHLRLV